MKTLFQKIGPGLLVAAAGIGAGDMIISIQTGLEFRWIYPLVVILACVLKYTITEGIAKHQLASGKSLIERWNMIMPLWARLLFMAFFIIWSYMVGAALISTTGLAASTIFTGLSKEWWAVLSSLLAFALVFIGKYDLIEKLTTTLILLMFGILVPAAVYYLIADKITPVTENQYEPLTLIMSMLGGVGGSVTMLSYSYWASEKKWSEEEGIQKSRTDLRLSYFITGIFILSLMCITFKMQKTGELKSGTDLILGLASAFERLYGEGGEILLKVCFWGVAFSSLLAVWSGVPYLFEDFLNGLKTGSNTSEPSRTSKTYRLFLAFLTLVPLATAIFQSAIKSVINYTLISSFFVLGISLSLLVMNNNKSWMGKWTNTTANKIILSLSLVVFGGLLIWQLLK
ncbi:Nramp family divalent metal transporter [Jiulongibacter sediminis]|jgi:Mn2+/Fe2+ NRAMP family transporter|uniref:Nramp family divalent metal transporter n=1 Tax=Jiulongibacter sediminis TaxID=1605367 RepID=UPI0026F1FC0B|nr:Nramp family divalent metal transporter [Jiulongibacter sediminis]